MTFGTRFGRMCSLAIFYSKTHIECVLLPYSIVRHTQNVFSYKVPGLAECVLLPQSVFSYHRAWFFCYRRMCSLAIECVLLPQNVFSCYRMCSLTISRVRRRNVCSCYRMCSLTIECVLLLQNVLSYPTIECVLLPQRVLSYHRMCSLTTARVLLLQNVFSYYRMCSLPTECVLLLQNVFSYNRTCSLTLATRRRWPRRKKHIRTISKFVR